MTSQNEITRLLQDLSAGIEGAGDALLPLVYDELHTVARHHMRHERRDHTLQTTALVHEAFLRLGGGEKIPWKSRAHFMNVAAKAMRRILIDYARSKNSKRKGGDREREPLEEECDLFLVESAEDLLAIDEALERLAEIDPRVVQMVELRFFVGLSVEDTAGILGISSRMVMYEWRMAKAWLKQQIA